MGHYLFRASYTQKGIEGVLKEGGSSRRAAVDRLVTSLEGHLETAYWAFGTDDFIAIAELPDNAAAARLAATVAATGTSRVTTTVLLTAEEVDAAARRGVEYRAPGS
jgi:uncharacterized protein with GYD domain